MLTRVVRGIRGAITVTDNTSESICTATRRLMSEIVQENDLQVDDVVSVLLTMTPDLTADFPARAVRSLADWEWVPLMCASEIAVEGAMPRCIRVLLHVNSERKQREMVHVYLEDAVHLRPDMAKRRTDVNSDPTH